MNMATFFNQTKWYSTQKKRVFQMAYFKFHKKNYWESSKLMDSKINPSRENHAHFIPYKPPHKNHPRVYFGPTLSFIQIATSVVEKSWILSVAFHLSTTVLIFNLIYQGYTLTCTYDMALAVLSQLARSKPVRPSCKCLIPVLGCMFLKVTLQSTPMSWHSLHLASLPGGNPPGPPSTHV